MTDDESSCFQTVTFNSGMPLHETKLLAKDSVITCVACHEPHGHDKERPGFGDGTTVCGGCHVKSMAVSDESHFPCPIGAVSCADCHMPLIIKTGGFFSFRSHAFRIVPPQTSQGIKMPNSCQNGGCHEDRSLEWTIHSFNDFYPQGKK